MSYESESEALDAEIVGVIERWHRDGTRIDDRAFDDLALRLFAYQLTYNREYARYCAQLGVTLSSMPASWEAIPAVPAGAFKEASLATFDPASAELTFETSGTTRGSAGRHYMENAKLYDAGLLAGFDRFVLDDGAKLRYLNLVPDPRERAHSSLGYMMGRVGNERGDGRTGWYLRGDELLLEHLLADVRAAIDERVPVCLTATAFALVHLLEAMDSRGIRFWLPRKSRVVETGGFKGRVRSADRGELYARISDRFGVGNGAIVAEYGMTELTSQYYDESRTSGPESRRKTAPPWLRARVVGPDRATVAGGAVGSLIHVDLANRSSCVAIQTEDLGLRLGDAFVLIGREPEASLRGCSLDAENLRASL